MNFLNFRKHFQFRDFICDSLLFYSPMRFVCKLHFCVLRVKCNKGHTLCFSQRKIKMWATSPIKTDATQGREWPKTLNFLSDSSSLFLSNLHPKYFDFRDEWLESWSDTSRFSDQCSFWNVFANEEKKPKSKLIQQIALKLLFDSFIKFSFCLIAVPWKIYFWRILVIFKCEIVSINLACWLYHVTCLKVI